MNSLRTLKIWICKVTSICIYQIKVVDWECKVAEKYLKVVLKNSNVDIWQHFIFTTNEFRSQILFFSFLDFWWLASVLGNCNFNYSTSMHELYFLIVFVNFVFVLFLGLLTFFLKMVLLAMIVFDWHSWRLPSFWLHLKKYFTLEGWPLGIYSVERWKYFF